MVFISHFWVQTFCEKRTASLGTDASCRAICIVTAESIYIYIYIRQALSVLYGGPREVPFDADVLRTNECRRRKPNSDDANVSLTTTRAATTAAGRPRSGSSPGRAWTSLRLSRLRHPGRGRDAVVKCHTLLPLIGFIDSHLQLFFTNTILPVCTRCS